MATKLLNITFRAVEIFISVALIVVSAEVIVEVSARYIFHTPLPWGAEVSQTLLVWITFLGAADSARRGEHMSVTFILELIPFKKLRGLLLKASQLIMVLFLVIGTWSGLQVVERTWSMRTTTLQIPAGILYLALPVGFVITIFAILFPVPSGNSDGFFSKGNDMPPPGDWR